MGATHSIACHRPAKPPQSKRADGLISKVGSVPKLSVNSSSQLQGPPSCIGGQNYRVFFVYLRSSRVNNEAAKHLYSLFVDNPRLNQRGPIADLGTAKPPPTENQRPEWIILHPKLSTPIA